MCIFLVSIFLWFSYLRVSDPATWNAVATSQRSSNLVDGWLPLSEGMPVFVASQGGNCFIGWLYSTGGVELLSLSFAILKTCTFLIWTAIFFRLTNARAALLASVAIVAASFFEIDGLTVMSLGQFFVAIMLWILASQINDQQIHWKNATPFSWIQMTVVMTIWANTDNSVFAGLLLLFLLAVHRLIEVRNRFIHDREFQHRVWLFQVCLLATAISPNGFASWTTLFDLDSFLNPFGGWQPSTMAGFNGVVVGLFWLARLLGPRSRSQKFSFFDLASIALTTGVACSQSMIAWFVPIICIGILQNSGKVAPSETMDVPNRNSLRFAFTLLSGLVLWIGFCFSPFGNQLLGGSQRSTAKITGAVLPVELKSNLDKLDDHPTVWSPLPWSDWLAVDNRIKLYMNRDEWRFPETVKREYHSIYRGANWQHLADKYDIDGMVIDKVHQTEFMPKFRTDSGKWQVAFENQSSMLIRRIR